MKVIDIIDECTNTTLRKHPADKEKFVKTALGEILNKNRYILFTSDKGARQRMRIIGNNALVVELIRGALLAKDIQEKRGEVRELGIGKNGYPESSEQAQNYIFNRIAQEESPSAIYAEVQRSTALRDLLIDNYAYLTTQTTKEEQEIADAYLRNSLPNKIETLDNLQNYLIDQNQNRIIEAQTRARNQVQAQNNGFVARPQR